MPRSGGIYTLPPGYFATPGQTIRTEQHNPPMEDIAQALTDSVARDGSAPMTGNLSMNGRKITTLGAGTAPSDAVRFDQLPTVLPAQATPYDTTAGRALVPGSFGLGLVGTAVPMSDIDAIDTASGTFRYTTGTTGTLPVGFTGAMGGVMQLLRGSTTIGREILQPDNSNALFHRRLAGTWQPWYQVVSLLDSTVADGDMIARVGAAWVRVPGGTAGKLLRSLGPAVIPAWDDQIVPGAPVALTGLTEYDFIGIPSWAKRITIPISALSMSGTDNILFQLGTSGGLVTSGYEGGGYVFTGGGGGFTASTAGMLMATQSAAEDMSGHITMTRSGAGSLTWVSSHTAASNARIMSGACRVTLPSALTQIRITRTGTNTFDGGTAAIMWE